VVFLWIAFWMTGTSHGADSLTWFSEMFWMSWGQLSGKAPKAKDPNGALWPTRGVRVIAAFAGMFAFSLIVGFIKSALKKRLKDLKLGKGRVFEKDFSMIIGWNDRILPLVDQLTLANTSAGGGVVVVLAPKGKPSMDSFFVDNLEPGWRGTKVVTRKGDTINPTALMKASAPYARSIVVLSQGEDADEADAQACRCVLALTGGMPFLNGHVVVELRDLDNSPVVRMGCPDSWDEYSRNRKVLPLVGNDLTGKLMVQSSIEAGLARCFCHILAFDGNEFYIKHWEQFDPEITGTQHRFFNACFQFEDAVCIGIRKSIPDPETGEYIILNPPGSDFINAGDKLIFIAEDDDSYQPSDPPVEVIPFACGEPPEWEAPDPPPSKILLVGWRRDIQDMIFEIEKWVSQNGPKSQLVMVADKAGPAGEVDDRWAALEEEDWRPDDTPHLEVVIKDMNPIMRKNLVSEELDIPSFDSCLVLTEERSGADGLCSDSRTMITMLLIRDIQKAAALEGKVTWGRKMPCNQATVISEILDPRTAELLKLAKADDHVVSNEIISMALGQMSEQADLAPLIDNLFAAEGEEIHIKDLQLYAEIGETLSFWEISYRARQRCEIAIGYQRREDVDSGAPDNGIVLNPPDKNHKLVWSAADKIVVIAQD